MNSKILNRLCTMFQSSPQLIEDSNLLQQAINGTFGVDIKDINFTNVKDLTEDKIVWTIVTGWKSGSSNSPISDDGLAILIDEIMTNL